MPYSPNTHASERESARTQKKNKKHIPQNSMASATLARGSAKRALDGAREGEDEVKPAKGRGVDEKEGDVDKKEGGVEVVEGEKEGDVEVVEEGGGVEGAEEPPDRDPGVEGKVNALFSQLEPGVSDAWLVAYVVTCLIAFFRNHREWFVGVLQPTRTPSQFCSFLNDFNLFFVSCFTREVHKLQGLAEAKEDEGDLEEEGGRDSSHDSDMDPVVEHLVNTLFRTRRQLEPDVSPVYIVEYITTYVLAFCMSHPDQLEFLRQPTTGPSQTGRFLNNFNLFFVAHFMREVHALQQQRLSL